jgi:hypothetical protein
LLGITDPTPGTPGDGGPDSIIDSNIDAPPPCAPAITLQAEQTSAIGATGSDFAIGRFNNGLDEDIAIATGATTTLLFGNRTGSFTGAKTIATAGTAIAIGDWDQNVSADDDFAMLTVGGTAVVARRQNRANDPPVEPAQPLMGPFTNVSRLFPAELASLGGIDLLVYDDSGSRIFAASGLNPGEFIRSAAVVAPVADEPIFVQQIDGQFGFDLVFINGTTVKLAVQSSGGTYANPVNIATGANSKGIAFGKFDGDGLLDLVVSTAQGLVLFRQNAASPGTFQMHGMISPVQSAAPMLVGDVNGDGRDDIITATAAILQCAPASVGGPGVFTQVEQLTAAKPAQLVDVTGDDKADLVRIDGTSVKVRVAP